MKQEEIARTLGISKTTVSRAISGNGRVGKNTREKVLKLWNGEHAGETGERKRTKNICVALPLDALIDSNHFFTDVLYGVCESVDGTDYDVMIIRTSENDISEIERVVKEEKTDGIILTRSLENDKALKFLSEQDFPAAVSGHTSFGNVISVDIDNEKAAKDLTSLLIAMGYRRFTTIIGNLGYKVNKSRRKGFIRGIAENGLSPEKQVIYTGEFSTSALERIASDIVSNKTECVVCGDDDMAVKVMSWLRNEGYRIPKDVGIASLYNSSALKVLTPNVTAVDASARNIGMVLGRQLVNKLEGEKFNYKTEVDYEILIRKSTQKVN